jgi:hypothetical protein
MVFQSRQVSVYVVPEGTEAQECKPISGYKHPTFDLMVENSGIPIRKSFKSTASQLSFLWSKTTYRTLTEIFKTQ